MAATYRAVGTAAAAFVVKGPPTLLEREGLGGGTPFRLVSPSKPSSCASTARRLRLRAKSTIPLLVEDEEEEGLNEGGLCMLIDVGVGRGCCPVALTLSPKPTVLPGAVQAAAMDAEVDFLSVARFTCCS